MWSMFQKNSWNRDCKRFKKEIILKYKDYLRNIAIVYQVLIMEQSQFEMKKYDFKAINSLQVFENKDKFKILS